MTEDTGHAGAEGLGESGDEIADAQRRLQEVAKSAAAAKQRATAEIGALEADLEKARLHTAEELEKLRAKHAEELKEEREAKELAISAAESRLAEIEAQAEAAERRVEEAERRAAEAEREVAEASARARESAAAWLRTQIAEIRREAGQPQ
jgi:colicin import membrane protein